MRTLMFPLVLAGCAGDDATTPDGHTDDPGGDCPGADTYVQGIEKTTASGRVVRIVSATPAPPDVGDNAWELEVLDPAGAPLEGLQIEIFPYMPLHGHGLVPERYGSTDLGDGTYQIETFDLVMPGLWEFTVDVGVGEGAADEAAFLFCAEG